MIVSFFQFNIDPRFLPFFTINICGANLGLFIFGDIPVMSYIMTQASFPRNHTV